MRERSSTGCTRTASPTSQVGRIRYGVLTTDGGRIMDDGTVARLGDDLFYVTTTSTGSESVCEWFEWWNAVWGYDVEIVNVTGALAAVNVAGPQAREALQRLTDDDVSNDALRYLDAQADPRRRRAVPRAADRLRRRARLRAPLRRERRRAPSGTRSSQAAPCPSGSSRSGSSGSRRAT